MLNSNVLEPTTVYNKCASLPLDKGHGCNVVKLPVFCQFLFIDVIFVGGGGEVGESMFFT